MKEENEEGREPADWIHLEDRDGDGGFLKKQ